LKRRAVRIINRISRVIRSLYSRVKLLEEEEA
jgi:hypothetical protein